MNDAHRALRDATRTAHDRLDRLFAGFDLGDRAAYARFLAAHADAMLPIEAALDAVDTAAVIADWPERRRADALIEDLADLGIGAALPAPLPCIDADHAEIAGTLYVLEGSRLGGRMLAKTLPEGAPRRYLDADQPAGNWRKLLDRLDIILYDPSRMEIAVSAALDVFWAFERAGIARLRKG